MRTSFFVLVMCVVAVLCGISVYASMTPYSEDGYGHDVTVYVKSGWNLVSTMQGIHLISLESEVPREDVKAAYIYVPSMKKYLEIDPVNEFAMTFDHWKDVSTAEEVTHLMFGSIWIYVKDGGYITYKSPRVPKPDEVTLYEGWNFFTITPEIKGVPIGEFKGTCNIVKVAYWDFSEWHTVTPESYAVVERVGEYKPWDAFVLGDSDSDVGKGLLVKVDEDCMMGAKQELTPPPVPN